MGWVWIFSGTAQSVAKEFSSLKTLIHGPLDLDMKMSMSLQFQ